MKTWQEIAALSAFHGNSVELIVRSLRRMGFEPIEEEVARMVRRAREDAAAVSENAHGFCQPTVLANRWARP